MIKTREVSIAHIEWNPGNIFCVKVKKGAEIELRHARELIHATNEMLDETIRFRGGVYDLSDITYLHDDARQYFTQTSEIKGQVVAVAMISKSFIGQLMGNMFLLLTDKNPYPIRYFDSKLKAKEWVLENMNAALHKEAEKKVA